MGSRSPEAATRAAALTGWALAWRRVGEPGERRIVAAAPALRARRSVVVSCGAEVAASCSELLLLLARRANRMVAGLGAGCCPVLPPLMEAIDRAKAESLPSGTRPSEFEDAAVCAVRLLAKGDDTLSHLDKVNPWALWMLNNDAGRLRAVRRSLLVHLGGGLVDRLIERLAPGEDALVERLRQALPVDCWPRLEAELVLEWNTEPEAAPPRPTPGRMDGLHRAAEALRLKGNEASIIRLLCDGGGRSSLASLMSVCEWSDTYSCWNPARCRLNRKLSKHGWRLTTIGGEAVAEAFPSARK